MPVITQLLTDSEYALLKDLLDEDSFFDCGSPHPIRLLQRDIDMARRVRELSSHFKSNGERRPSRSRMVQEMSQEFNLCVRMVWRILGRLEGRSNGHGKVLKYYVTDFAAVQG